MSKPDLDIIRSQEAQMFLRSVTEGFYDRSYLALWLFEVIGREWDEMAAWSNDLKQEIYVQTCTWSIAIWEWVYGFEPDESMTLEERRQRILSKVQGVRPINPEAMRRGISAVSGAKADVQDFSNPYSFRVTMNVTNKPIPMERVLRFLYETKPAHLAVNTEVMFPAIESTLHIGGTVGNRTIISVPRKPDTYDFHNELHAGGSPAIQTALPILSDMSAPLPATTILRTGGICTIISNLPPKGE